VNFIQALQLSFKVDRVDVIMFRPERRNRDQSAQVAARGAA